MEKGDKEKIAKVAAFLQGWLAFKTPIPNEEVVKLHFELLMEVLDK